MELLVVAALLWLAVHIGIAGTRLRAVLVGPLGDNLFRGVFSGLSLASIGFLVWAFRAEPAEPLWTTPLWLRWVLVAAMLPAFLLFVGSVANPNPTAMQPGVARVQPPRGIIRVTRHPMLCGFTLWALVHIIGTGEAAALIFFGAFLVTAVAGMPSIDAKLARRDPNFWQALSAATSIVPFAAIAAGRNRFVPREIGWVTPVVGIAAWILLLLVHPWLFGVGPLGASLDTSLGALLGTPIGTVSVPA